MSETQTRKYLHVKTCIRSVTTAGTREQFLDGDPKQYNVKAITIRANATNAGNIYFGGDNRVTTTDYHHILAPGEELNISILEIDRYGDMYLNPTEWWIDADTDGDGLTYAALIDAEPW